MQGAPAIVLQLRQLAMDPTAFMIALSALGVLLHTLIRPGTPGQIRACCMFLSGH